MSIEAIRAGGTAPAEQARSTSTPASSVAFGRTIYSNRLQNSVCATRIPEEMAIVTRIVLSALAALTVAKGDSWKPIAGIKEFPLWTSSIPHTQPDTGKETIEVSEDKIAGNPFTLVGAVSEPALYFYPAKGINSGACVVIYPGGGYVELAMDLEGTEVCEWLTGIGVNCVLVKYRVPGPNLYPKPAPFRKAGSYPRSPVALSDAQRAIKLVRFNAQRWGVNPDRVGVLGFSAGGHLVAATSTLYDKEIYPRTDVVDDLSSRPDFGVAIYPGHLWNWNYEENPPLALNPAVPVNEKTPPTFILQAQDDPVDDVRHSLVYYLELNRFKVPTEMHLYASGGHAFGLRKTKDAITEWPRLVERWFVTIGVLDKLPN